MGKNIFRIFLIFIAVLIAQGSKRTSSNDQAACENFIKLDPIEFSPTAEMNKYEHVFWAETIVTPRKCSLGLCAGVRLLRNYKGKSDKTALLTFTHFENSCQQFAMDKGQRWLVFANQGLSQKGHSYLEVDLNGPSTDMPLAPNFAEMDRRHFEFRKRFDTAVNTAYPTNIRIKDVR